MKRIIPFILILLYVCFILFLLSPGGGHHGHSMYDIVIGHLTDHPVKKVPINATDNFIAAGWKSVNNAIAKINKSTLGNIKIDLGLIKGDMRITKWVIMLWIAMLACILIFVPLARSIKKNAYGSKSRWVNMWEALIGFVHDEIVEPNFDHKYIKKAMPFFLSIFFFILFCNLFGLIPGSATATGNLAVTGGMALFTLFGMVTIGSIKQGPFWIIKGIVPHGIPFVMYFLLWPIEFAGLFIKPFALMVRLFANMTAGHVVIIIFIYLVMMFKSYAVGGGSVVGSLMIYMLELLVAFIQAYIFASLSAMFIGSSMHAH